MKQFFPPAKTPLQGSLSVSPDKSISQRAALLAAMSQRPVVLEHFLRAGDTHSLLCALAALGVRHECNQDHLTVFGVGLHGLRQASQTLNLGNSGTALRLLIGWLAGQRSAHCWTLDGDCSLRQRPVDRIITPLRKMGASIWARGDRSPPVTVQGCALVGRTYELPVASAQIKSAVLLAGLVADGRTTVVEPSLCRDHTERLLALAGVPIKRVGQRVTVTGVSELELPDLTIGGDPSAAAFHVAAALLVPGSALKLPNILANWTRSGFIEVVRRMGANIAVELETPSTDLIAGEPLCDYEIQACELVATTVEEAEIGLTIDELPLVALLGAFAEGQTVVKGAQELRVKETDRIAGVVTGLRSLGAKIEATADGFVVTGTNGLVGGEFQSHGDHRLAMLGAVAGLASREGVLVHGTDAALTSYPKFFSDLARLSEPASSCGDPPSRRQKGRADSPALASK